MSDKVIDKSGWSYTILDNAIIETDKLDIYEKMFYIALKRFANIQTGEAFPGVKRVAQYACMSERKARDVIAALTEKRLIHVERRTNNTNVYTILRIPQLFMEPPAHDAGGAHGAGGVVHTVQGGGAPGADKLQKDNYRKITTNNDDDDEKAPANAFTFYQQNFGVLSNYVHQDIGAWIDDFNAHEIVIEAMKLALENQKPWSYAKAILKDWFNHNLKTIEQIQIYQQQKKGGRSDAAHNGRNSTGNKYQADLGF